jgi:23S rRNA pseudouridine1911/1915/1917 synthase
LQPGEVVEVQGQWGGAPPPEPDAPLRIVLERADLVVVDKPAGQPTAPLGELGPGTLAGALLGRYPEMLSVGYRAREPGLLHRLDTPTSGLVIAARCAPVFAALREALSRERLHKRYLAIVEDKDVPDAGVIERPLLPDPGSGRVRVAELGEADARPRVTRFRTLERRGPWALLEVTAPRAYRHQVRVHLASEGWPIAGDRDYGGSGALVGRHALHASHVSWAGDEHVAAFSADSPLPVELRAFLDSGALAL